MVPLEQLSKYANLFFLFTACIQQIPNVSPTNQYTNIAPLSAVLLASFKEVQEDMKSGKIFELEMLFGYRMTISSQPIGYC
ncbi:aminophospholipid translocase [Stygiomarasmius scandens]|uniref:Aminophospholipid translocase n=1 Tax=Marasmiellus scandens TaxID=2682957 RepID=A0ABR1JG77_9AGAR